MTVNNGPFAQVANGQPVAATISALSVEGEARAVMSGSRYVIMLLIDESLVVWGDVYGSCGRTLV